MAKVLTPLSIQNAKPRRRQGKPVLTEISDGGCKGLRLCIQATGSLSWIVRYRFAGRTRKLTLGACLMLRPGEADPGNGALTLPAARRAASDALHRLAMGHDPGAEKVQATQAVAGDSFQKVAEACFARAKVEKDIRTADQQLATLRRLVFPILGDRLISTIKRSEVVRLLDGISVANGPTQADAVLAIIGRVMADHARRDDNYASVIVRGMRRTSTKERARERMLDDDELRRVWQASSEGIFGAFVRFLLLTACRRNEAAHLVWSELGNGNGLTWTLPVARNKGKRELVRPLSNAAQAVLAALPRSSDLVFQADGRKVSAHLAQWKAEFDQACGVKGWVLHDLRRTSRSLMSRAGVPDNHAERCLGHVIPGVRGTYDRHRYTDEMRTAYEALSSLVECITNPQNNVVPLHGRETA
jgi:integrase